MSPENAGERPGRSTLLAVLEGFVWVVLVVVALGSALLVNLLVQIDCNGLWGERPDLQLRRRSTARRGARAGGR